MAHGPAGAPPRAPPSPLIRRLAPALYLCLILAPVVAQALLAIGPWSDQLPWPTLATVYVLAGLTLLTLTGAIGRRPLLAFTLAAGVTIVVLSGTLVATAVALAVALAAFASGTLVLRLIAPPGLPALERALYAAALGFGVISYATLALALAGALFPLAAIAAIAIPIVLARGELLASSAELRARLRPPARGPAGPMLAAGCVWAIVILVAATAPEVAYDSLSYHLGLPRVWIDAGRMVDVPEQLQSYYYLAAEMSFTLAMLLGGAVAAKLISLTFFLMAVAGTYVVARRMSSPRAATIAAALFATTPAIAWQGTATYVDVAVTLYVFLGAIAALRARESASPRIALVAGLLLGLAVATKLTALLAVAPVVLLLGASALRSHAATGDRLRLLGASGIAFGAALAPWPILRYLQTGNPVFPFLNGIFRSPLWPDLDVVSNPAYSLEGFGLGKDPAGLLGTPFALSYMAERFDDGAFGAGFGITLLLLPLATLALRRSTEVRYLALVSIATFVVWVLSVPYARYLLPIFPALCILAGVGLAELASSADRLTARVARAVPAVLMVATFPLILFMFPLASGRIPYAVALGLESDAAYLTRTLPSYEALRRIGTADSYVLMLSFHAGAADDEDRLYAPGRVETISSLWTQELIGLTDADAAMAAIRERGFTHVYVNRRYVEPRARGAVVMGPTFFDEADLEYERDGVELHRLR